jgi:hypothetical protein
VIAIIERVWESARGTRTIGIVDAGAAFSTRLSLHRRVSPLAAEPTPWEHDTMRLRDLITALTLAAVVTIIASCAATPSAKDRYIVLETGQFT